MVHLGHRFFVVEAGELRLEQFFLQVGVVEFGVGVGQLHAVDEQLEPFGDGRVVAFAFGQRANAAGVVDHKDRADQGVFDLGLEDFVFDDIRVAAFGVDVQRLGKFDNCCFVGRVDAGVLLEEIVVGASLERRREVDRLVGPLQLERLADRLDRVADTFFGEVHHRAVIAVRLIDFEHREFGVVRLVDALVAVDAAHLVDTLDAADHQTLEVQFECDTQREIDVERIVVRRKRSGGCTAGDAVQRRAFDLDKLFGVQRLADRANDFGAIQNLGSIPSV